MCSLEHSTVFDETAGAGGACKSGRYIILMQEKPCSNIVRWTFRVTPILCILLGSPIVIFIMHVLCESRIEHERLDKYAVMI